MKRKKYGEETVVIRVPASRKEDVLKFLERFEVVGDFSQPKDFESPSAFRDAYIQGFNDCFIRWDNYQVCLPYILTGNEKSIPLLQDCLQGRVPQSAMAAVMDQLGQVLLSSSQDVDPQCSSARKFLDDAIEEARGHIENQSNFLKLG